MSELWDFTAPSTEDPDRPSDLELDRLHAGELDAEAAARIQARLADSPEDQARFEALDRHFDDIDEVDPRRMMAAIRRGAERPPTFLERLKAQWTYLLVGGLAAAAAAALFLARGPAPTEPIVDDQPLDVVALKGGPVLHVQRRGADGVGEPISSKQAVQPGDTLKFQVTLGDRARVRIIGLEQSGARYDVWPLEGGPSPVLDRGEQRALEGAVTLDDAPGQEQLFLVACPESLEPNDCQFGGSDGAPDCPEGCKTDTFVLNKQSP